MTNEQVAAVIGGVIGVASSLLTTLLTSFTEKKKIKRHIKQDMIRYLYLFFNARKIYTDSLNKRSLTEITLKRALGSLNPDSNTDYVRTEISKVRDEILDLDAQCRHYFEKLAEVESHILARLIEIADYFSKSKQNRVSALVMPHIKYSNTVSPLLYDYEKIDAQEYHRLQKELHKELMDHAIELGKVSDGLITKVSKCL